jgi:hypothetical protein
MKLNCLSCGHTLDLRGNYDDHEGLLKCFICGALMALHTEKGHVKRVTMVAHLPQDDQSQLQSTSPSRGTGETSPPADKTDHLNQGHSP